MAITGKAVVDIVQVGHGRQPGSWIVCQGMEGKTIDWYCQ